jgi:hypothetical protein
MDKHSIARSVSDGGKLNYMILIPELKSRLRKLTETRLAPSIKGGLLLLLGVNLGNPAKVSVDRGLKVEKRFKIVFFFFRKAIFTLTKTIAIVSRFVLALAAWAFR